MTLRKTMTGQDKWPVAIIGSGNIGTDLMIKIARRRATDHGGSVGILIW
jgi:acetaldehyde dehydrogenase (acetylating)